MADTNTTNYSLVKPEVGASADTWGTKLNNNMDSIDSQMKTNADDIATKQASSTHLTTLDGLSKTDGNFVVTNGTTYVAESGATARTSLGLGSLATLNAVGSSQITDNTVGAAELNVSGNGTSGQYLASDGDGSFSWVSGLSSSLYSATGGTITTNGDYKIHKFTTSGTFTVSSASEVHGIQVVCVAGGGSSGTQASSNNRGGGGGGAGGLRFTTIFPPTGAITITVGSGGAAVSGSYLIKGNDGNDSSVGAYVVADGGGAGGAGATSQNAGVGGSGGGAGSGGTVLAAGTTSSAIEGTDGGAGTNVSFSTGGAGGGYLAAGGDYVTGGDATVINPSAAGTIEFRSIIAEGTELAKGGGAFMTATHPEKIAGPANTGQGGASTVGTTSLAGGSGVVYLIYKYQ